MSLENLALATTHDFPIKHVGKVHSGKVRSVYWLHKRDSKRLIKDKGYDVNEDSRLGVMITSDRISAFDVVWRGAEGLAGVPGKGAALNAISQHWFSLLEQNRFSHHFLEAPHSLVWIVQQAEPLKIEAVLRQYITGSMWRAYEQGEREFCGVVLPSDLAKNQRLAQLLYTPTTKGIMRGIKGIDRVEDAKVSVEQLLTHYQKFGFRTLFDVFWSREMAREGFRLVENELQESSKLLFDTKFELGYLQTQEGRYSLGFIDEVVTPDSSRIVDAARYEQGEIYEESKEPFRQFLLAEHGRETLLDDAYFSERQDLAKKYEVPVEKMKEISQIYGNIAQTITKQELPLILNPQEEIIKVLNEYGVIEK